MIRLVRCFESDINWRYEGHMKSLFCTLKAKFDALEQQVDHLEFELEEALREYDPITNEGYD